MSAIQVNVSASGKPLTMQLPEFQSGDPCMHPQYGACRFVSFDGETAVISTSQGEVEISRVSYALLTAPDPLKTLSEVVSALSKDADAGSIVLPLRTLCNALYHASVVNSDLPDPGTV